MENPDAKNILRSYGLKPKDYLGQNFLFDEEALSAIVDAADIKNTDTVLEVGPGLGSMTRILSEKAGRVVAVEKDRRFMGILRKELRGNKNVELINEDILRFHISEKLGRKFKVVANIPYYLTSKLIEMLLALKDKPELIVVLIQKEVAERIVAGPGKLSVLGVSVQFFADASIIASVPRASFWPAPEVDSAVISIIPKQKFSGVEEKAFFRIIKSAFAGKRKQIHNTLGTGFGLNKEQTEAWLKKAGIPGTVRPQELSLEEWIRLYESRPS